MNRQIFNWVVFVFVMAAVAVIYSRLDNLSIDFSDYTSKEFTYFGIFACFFVLATLIRAVRFGFLTRKYAPIKYSQVISNFPWLFLIGAMTPFRAGESARILWVKSLDGSASSALGNLITERLADLFVILLFAAIGIFLAPEIAEIDLGHIVLILGGLLIAAALAGWLLVKSGALSKDKLTAFMSGLKAIEGPIDAVMFLGLTIVIWSLILAGFYVVLSGVVGVPHIGAAMLCLAGVNIARLFSPAPGNIGTYQAAMIAALAAYHVDFSQALKVGLLLNAVMLVTVVALGLLSWLTVTFTRLGHIPKDQS